MAVALTINPSQKVSYSSFQIANHFIKKAGETGSELTPMKLMKLVYLGHGWHLGVTGKPLISERVQAWKYGPVIPNLYHQYKDFGRGQIGPSALTDVDPVTDPETIQFLDVIWDIYAKFSGGQLSTLTHEKDSPWWKTWNDHGGSEKKGAIIPEDSIRDFYAEAAK